MDLVAGVRKEGSRGGRADFKWEHVKDDAQRENYLGHSLMAPVGRWQRNRDLNWYAKASSQDPAEQQQSAADARKEELRKIKEAEQDALSEALGYGPMPGRNANETPLGKKEVEKAIKETAGDEQEGDDDAGGAKGVGFGHLEALQRRAGNGEEREVLGGVGMDDDWAGARRGGEDKERKGEKEKRRKRSRSWSRSRSRDRGDRKHRHKERHRRRSRSRSRSRERSRERRPCRREEAVEDEGRRHRRYRDRSDSYNDRRRERDRHSSYRRRSSSPERRRRQDDSYEGYRDRRR